MTEFYPKTGLPKIAYGQTFAGYIRQHGDIGTLVELLTEVEVDSRKPCEPTPSAPSLGAKAVEGSEI